jgi:branched-subunit amino acid transport protein
MTPVWITVAALCVGTALLKASGPLVLGERRPPERALSVIAFVAPAVLTSLIVYQTFGDHPSGLTVDARLVGLGAAALALAARAPILLTVLVAALATAVTRALF